MKTSRKVANIKKSFSDLIDMYFQRIYILGILSCSTQELLKLWIMVTISRETTVLRGLKAHFFCWNLKASLKLALFWHK